MSILFNFLFNSQGYLNTEAQEPGGNTSHTGVVSSGYDVGFALGYDVHSVAPGLVVVDGGPGPRSETGPIPLELF
ncbi:MAG: hypothetical protein Q8M24_09890 [Pseudolabrys sp.]|nr:hypothetical protein [Pseudolabrys sp.]